ncbi:MAG TPA: ferritin-like domain-containing protein [Acidobacteriaceae bacterium]|jgi:ferritin-like metal-binding protein YciE|nr:ferritin-like domain-containing protein [Acidobacteriaceae bacterium]
MGLFTPDINNLRELYTTMLQRAVSMERQLIDEGLPTMIENATSPQLRDAFRTHLEETKEHASRVERILQENTGDVDSSKCKVMAALIAEGGASAKEATDQILRDVVLIAAGNQVEHHEIAVYGTLRNMAIILGQADHAALLDRTLEEEKHADKLLTELSEQINVAAPVA